MVRLGNCSMVVMSYTHSHMWIVSLLSLAAASAAYGQGFDIGDKTVIATNGMVTHYFFIAPSGKIYFVHQRADDPQPNPQAKWGIEYEIGKTREVRTRVFPSAGVPG